MYFPWNLAGDLENGVLSGVMGMDGLCSLLTSPGRDLREPREASRAPLRSR